MPDSRRAILTYHSLDDSGSVISVAPQLFARQMELLASSGVRVVRLSELRGASSPALALTFDDGFQNFADVAAPELARHGFPATVFLVTDYCGGKNNWPSQRPSIPILPLMGWSTIAELSGAGIDFGAHTATHPDLAQLDDAAAREEILRSKRRAEDATGKAVASFAYPYGSMPAAARQVVGQNFAFGCSTRLGFVGANSPRVALERLDVYYLRRLSLFKNLFSAPVGWYLGFRGALREWA
jgi:peptidoglycan/xylan/chitin deacetylase (PgdA/CDA1 family)